MKYRFDDCELDTDSRELTRNGDAIAVEPQVFDLLVYLIENPDRLINHSDLIESVWNGRIVSDSAIAARISAARKAVGDSGKEQRVIKTVSRKGFRFLPAVESLTGDSNAPEPVSTAHEPAVDLQALDHQQIHFCKSADGTRIAYARTGQGVPLVRTGHWLTHLEHDWHSPIWRPFLDRMGRHFEVVRYDQRGCGLSDWELSDLAFERFVEDLEAVVDASGYERFVLYATSQGVPVAVEYAVRHPERVSHLVFLGGYATGRLVRNNAAEVEQGEAILKLIEHGWGVSGSPFLQAFTTMYVPGGNRDQIDSLVELQRLTTSPANAVAIRRAVDSFDVADRLARVAVKTLVMHAANDGVHPVAQGREIAAGIPDCEFVLLDSANHAILPQEAAWERFFGELQLFTAP
ncbi:MAG: alpha/beta fold hydrolase [Gammaproteobacteria bacterium]|jgi:DNA-binding winged helix-turn-helix (wHTH) protein/pimeloyl-ACP methyl ester carboxylesterase|nr:alpha/beta fold hydrolase [Gammaproteobacteria bacterium]